MNSKMAPFEKFDNMVHVFMVHVCHQKNTEAAQHHQQRAFVFPSSLFFSSYAVFLVKLLFHGRLQIEEPWIPQTPIHSETLTTLVDLLC